MSALEILPFASDENRVWAYRMWQHYFDAKKNDRLVRTSFWRCVRGTIALMFDLQFQPSKDEPDYGYPQEKEAVAWHIIGPASFEYGGEAWDYISVRGFRFYRDSDCSI